MVAGGLSLALLASCARAQDAASLVSVGDHRLEVIAKGEGVPAVVFESGFTGGLFLLRNVQNRVAERTRTIAYERAVIFTAKTPLGSWPLKSEADMALFVHEHDALALRIPGVERVTIDSANHLTVLNEPQLGDKILMLVNRVRTGR